MAPTLRRLLASPGLGVRVIAGAGALDRPVSWVAVSELADPTGYLEGGELVLLTGVHLDLGAEPSTRYVERLVAREVCGVGFGVGIVHDAVPPGLVEAAAAAGLPLVEVDRPTPFIALGKALSDLLAAEQVEGTRRRLDGMRALTSALAEGGDVSAALGRLAMLGGGWAAVLDTRGAVVAQSTGHPPTEVARGLVGQLKGRGTHSSASAVGDHGRVTVIPIGVGERPKGYLAVGTPAGAELDHHLVTFAGSLLTLDRERSSAPRDVVRWARAASLTARLQRAAPTEPADLLGPLARPGAHVRAVVVRADAQTVEGRLAEPERVGVLALDGETTLLVVVEEDLADVLGAVTSLVAETGGGVSATASLGDLVRAVDEAAGLAARARGRVDRAEDAAPTLLELLGPVVAQAFAHDLLAPLFAVSEEDGAQIATALTTWLRHRERTGEAAEALGVHRHTLRERLRRAERLLERDLDDPQTRAELWVALEARGDLRKHDARV